MPKIKYQDKRFRKDSLERIHQANAIIADYQAQGFDLTLRQLYYQFVARDLIPNTEKSYDSLGALISDARLAGLIDWNVIHDRTRNLRSNNHWGSPGSIVEACASQYKIDRWATQPYRPEIWIEKDALVGVLEAVCERLDVPYFSCRGYTSQSEMWRAGQRLLRHKRADQTPIIFHFGDHDPSGIDMSRDIRDRLEMFTGGQVRFVRVALNMSQIEELNPPPNPAKVTDSRFLDYQAKYGDQSWELDALEPTAIVELVEQSINSILEADPWRQAESREASERGQLERVSSNWDDVLRGLD